MRKASRSGPRETPRRAASATSVSFSPGGSSPERIIRSSSLCTTLDERAGLQQGDGRVGRGRGSGDCSGHEASRPVRSPIVNNLQETVDAFVTRRLDCPADGTAPDCHRIGIRFARAGGVRHRSFTQSIQGSSHESGFIQGAARRRAACRFLRRARRRRPRSSSTPRSRPTSSRPTRTASRRSTRTSRSSGCATPPASSPPSCWPRRPTRRPTW